MKNLFNNLSAILFLILLTNCMPSQLLGPSHTPTNTPVVIKEGNWVNDTNSLSFTVKGSNIFNFRFDIDKDRYTCTVEIEEMEIFELKMEYQLWIDDPITRRGYETMNQYGMATPESRDEAGRIQIQTFYILGTFTNTSVSGKYQLIVCKDALSSSDKYDDWSAQWNSV